MNGHSINFWYDNWTGKGPIRCMVHGPLNSAEDSISVRDFLSNHSDFSNLSIEIPHAYRNIILGIPFSPIIPNRDVMCWNLSTDGKFTVNSVYEFITRARSGNLDTPHIGSNKNWTDVWSLKLPPKLSMFVWELFYQCLPTRDFLCARNMNVPSTCPVCNINSESILHLFRDCSGFIDVWNFLNIPVSMISSFALPLNEWLCCNLFAKCGYDNGYTPWYLVFIFTIRGIWLARNNVVFGKSPRINHIALSSPNLAKEYYAITSMVKRMDLPSFKVVKWYPPPLNYFKLNTDGSSIGNPGPAGAGTIIRDHNGKWISGSHRYIGHTSNMVALLWALRDGLTIAKDLGIELLHVEVDSTTVITSVSNLNLSYNSLSLLILDCRTLLDGFREISFKHVFREANSSADTMAKMRSSSRFSCSSSSD